MRFMLMPWRAEGAEHSVQGTGLVAHEHHQRVRSWPEAFEQLRGEHQEAVVLSARSSIGPATTRRP